MRSLLHAPRPLLARAFRLPSILPASEAGWIG